jgi:hypothetical protein
VIAITALDSLHLHSLPAVAGQAVADRFRDATRNVRRVSPLSFTLRLKMPCLVHRWKMGRRYTDAL